MPAELVSFAETNFGTPSKSIMELFLKKANSLKANNYFRKKHHHRCLTGFQGMRPWRNCFATFLNWSNTQKRSNPKFILIKEDMQPK